MQDSYVHNPKIQSQNLMQQTNKFWAKNDKMKLADTTGERGPIDCFKVNRVKPEARHLKVAEKV